MSTNWQVNNNCINENEVLYIDKGPGKEGAKTQGGAIANGNPLQWPLCPWASTPRFDGRFGCS
jgi:hypothetical protein